MHSWDTPEAPTHQEMGAMKTVIKLLLLQRALGPHL